MSLDLIAELLTQRYITDDQGRLVGDCSGGVPPRVIFARSQEGCLWRFRSDLDSDLVIEISKLAARERGFPLSHENPPPPPDRLAVMARVLGVDGAPASSRYESIEGEDGLRAELWMFD